MGVKNLWDILESCKKTLPLHHLQNKRVCIDLSCWIVQLHSVSRTHCAMKEKLYLRGLFHRLRALIALNCTLVFVADGSIPAIKLSTYRRRLNQPTEVSQDEVNSHRLKSVRRNVGSEFSCMIKEAKLLGAALGIPCLDGVEEAEAQCALLNSESLCDGCFTSDSDAFLFGARTVYRDICLGEGGYVVCYEMEDIETKLGFGRSSLITLALLLGSDYSPGVHGIGRESACHIVKSVGESAILQRVMSEGLSFAKKPKGIKKQEQSFTSNKENDYRSGENNIPMDNQFMRVVNAYLRPKCHSADSNAVHRVLAFYPFNCQQLQQICNQFFDWPPEKTDEYILPKFAERDLRRYANLRCTSSELGLCLSFDEMPIKCPISEILKQRKLQGRDCFEVSWGTIDGLKSSIVPADLVESACPEKVLEFHARRAQVKKPNGQRLRAKKVDSNAAVDEVHLKLHNLQIDAEHQCSPINNDSLLRGSESESTSDIFEVNQTNHTQHFGSDSELENNKPGTATLRCNSTVSTTSRVYETEVIDLISPSPKVLARRIAKCQETDVQCIDIIELSESEDELSPEHTRKAQELRSFIANIKHNID